jgi:hypothetical protein
MWTWRYTTLAADLVYMASYGFNPKHVTYASEREHKLRFNS